MEFLLFLGAKEKIILELVQKVEYKVEENTPLCLLGKQYFGFLKKSQKRIVICSENAKRRAGHIGKKMDIYSDSFDRAGIYIRRALRHESVHIAQHCNDGNVIEVESKKKLKIHPYKLDSLKGSTRISGKEKHEYQAYTLEDRPKLIIAALRKYCL